MLNLPKISDTAPCILINQQHTHNDIPDFRCDATAQSKPLGQRHAVRPAYIYFNRSYDTIIHATNMDVMLLCCYVWWLLSDLSQTKLHALRPDLPSSIRLRQWNMRFTKLLAGFDLLSVMCFAIVIGLIPLYHIILILYYTTLYYTIQTRGGVARPEAAGPPRSGGGAGCVLAASPLQAAIIYIYIYREREGDIDIYVYIYIYVEREREI